MVKRPCFKCGTDVDAHKSTAAEKIWCNPCDSYRLNSLHGRLARWAREDYNELNDDESITTDAELVAKMQRPIETMSHAVRDALAASFQAPTKLEAANHLEHAKSYMRWVMWLQEQLAEILQGVPEVVVPRVKPKLRLVQPRT